MLTYSPERLAELRKLWREYHDTRDRIRAEREDANARWWATVQFGSWEPAPPPPQYPDFPNLLRDLPCGATTRKGLPCRRTDLERNGRCKFHGGRSTGPKTAAGKGRAKANLRQYRQPGGEG